MGFHIFASRRTVRIQKRLWIARCVEQTTKSNAEMKAWPSADYWIFVITNDYIHIISYKQLNTRRDGASYSYQQNNKRTSSPREWHELPGVPELIWSSSNRDVQRECRALSHPNPVQPRRWKIDEQAAKWLINWEWPQTWLVLLELINIDIWKTRNTTAHYYVYWKEGAWPT